jgi:acetyltransferase-like isoleucine patch superfamily enzyme
LILRKNGVTIGKGCDILSSLVFHNYPNYSILLITTKGHLNKFFFDLRDKIILQGEVVISLICNFITHSDISKSDKIRYNPPEQAGIEIQDNNYIGANSTAFIRVTIMKDTLIAVCLLVDTRSNLIIG